MTQNTRTANHNHATPTPILRHDEADTRLVKAERSDIIDAAAALSLMARDNRRQANSRANGGPHNASYRAYLRDAAAVYDAAAKRMQDAADGPVA